MITTGSKFLVGAAVIATLSAIAYGVTQDGVMGTIGLVSAALALWFIAAVNLFLRDSNVWADEIASVETAAAGVRAPAASVWPFGFGFASVVLVVGLVTYQPVFIIGVVLLLVSGAEWTAEAWAERASADAAHNAEVRGRLANPLEFPVAAAIGIGILVYSFSRIMLHLSKTNTVIAFTTLAAIVLVLAYIFAYRPGVKPKAAVFIIAAGAIGLITGGAVTGLSGERTVVPHETTAGLNEEGVDICTSAKPFEADANASQSVGATAAVAARITLGNSGQLTYRLNGPSAQGADGITLPRSNSNNIVFQNNSGEQRRLSISLGDHKVQREGKDEVVAYYQCTTLVDDGGAQNITMKIGVPSTAFADGFSFFVPGVESARLNLSVP